MKGIAYIQRIKKGNLATVNTVIEARQKWKQ